MSLCIFLIFLVLLVHNVQLSFTSFIRHHFTVLPFHQQYGVFNNSCLAVLKCGMNQKHGLKFKNKPKLVEDTAYEMIL